MDIQTEKYYCSKCKNEIIDSYSSKCCGAIAINKNGISLLNVKFQEFLTPTKKH